MKRAPTVHVLNTPREYVAFMKSSLDRMNADGHKVWGDPTRVYEFLLDHGQEFKGTRWTKWRGSGYRRMPQKFCFNNAFLMSLSFPELTYYEGWANCGLTDMHHAWCVTEDGRVVDPTWRMRDVKRPEEDWDYFGVGLDSDALADWWFAKPTADVLMELDYDSNVEELIAVAGA